MEIKYEKQPPLYMAMLNHVRQGYSNKNYNWPEVSPEEVKTLYPNILAEKYASHYSIHTLADHAQVSEAVMIDVFQGGGDLSLDEYLRLVRLFGLGNQEWEYLAERELRMADPTIEEDEKLMEELDTLVRRIPNPMPRASWSFQQLEKFRREMGIRTHPDTWIYELAKSTDDALKDGKEVPYAVLRWSVSGLRRELALMSKPKIRMHRLDPVEAELGDSGFGSTGDMVECAPAKQEATQDRDAENKVTYELYQLPSVEEVRKLMFLSWDQMQKNGYTVDPRKYECVYMGKLEGTNLKAELEALFSKFNSDLDREAMDYRGRSMSVSDVVVIRGQGKPRAFYCDRVGFREIEWEMM